MKSLKILSYIPLHKRLDIIVKLLYLESIESKRNTGFYKSLYLKHIELRTGFKEDHKKSSEDFLNDFKNLLESIKEGGFQKKSFIILGNNWCPLSWAHRIACCMYLGIEPVSEIQNKEKGISWDIDWFIKNNFSREEITSILKKYREISRKQMVVLWPSCDTKHMPGEVLRYKVEFETPFLLQEVIYDIYSFEKYNNTEIGIQQKAEILWKHKFLSVVFLWKKQEKDSLRKELITYIRDNSIHENDKYFFTFHSWDTPEENSYIADILLSRNYFFHLCLRNTQAWNNFQKLIQKIPPIYNRDMCIVGSWPLGIYNLGKVSDIDLIEKNPTGKWIIKKTGIIDILDYQYYKNISNTDIIEQYFFYWRGYKFISLKVLEHIKSLWLRKKDWEQSQIIHDFLKSNTQYSETLWDFIKRRMKYYRTRFLVSSIHTGMWITKKLWIYETVSYYWRKYILSSFR